MGKRDGSDETWAKIKFDRQIVAIAKVHNATKIYTDDRGLRAIAERASIAVAGIGDLPLPSSEAQMEMFHEGNVQDAASAKEEREPEAGDTPPSEG
jgi:hypothetical protein